MFLNNKPSRVELTKYLRGRNWLDVKSEIFQTETMFW